jgi:hypothetical protein
MLFSRAAQRFLELQLKALYFAQPRSQKFWSSEQPRREFFWNCDQKHCSSFSRTAKKLCDQIVQPRSENFWNCEQRKHCILFNRAAIRF